MPQLDDDAALIRWRLLLGLFAQPIGQLLPRQALDVGEIGAEWHLKNHLDQARRVHGRHPQAAAERRRLDDDFVDLARHENTLTRKSFNATLRCPLASVDIRGRTIYLNTRVAYIESIEVVFEGRPSIRARRG